MFQLNEQQEALQLEARKLAQITIAPRAAEVDRTEQYPWDNIEAFTKAGFMGMTVPTELGGQGRSYLDTVLVIEEMAKVCGISGRIIVEGNMGAIGAVLAYGQTASGKSASAAYMPSMCLFHSRWGSCISIPLSVDSSHHARRH